MADERTTVTELTTALGMLRYPSVERALAARAPELDIGNETWARLADLHAGGRFAAEFAAGFANGHAFLEARDGLRHRPPVLVEWTGARRAPGDEVAPIDLRVDHVYLVSCKYLSRVLANASPARVFEGLLTTARTWDPGHWYERVALPEYQALYDACRQRLDLGHLPGDVTALTSAHRQDLKMAFPRGAPYPDTARERYGELCRVVSEESARRWTGAISPATREALLWRLLRIGSAPYYVLGATDDGPVRLRVATPWDWRQRYELVALTAAPAGAGQPQVDWTASYRDRCGGTAGEVRGHVEIRWSHGRFCGHPEAKVYLDTPLTGIPGYFPVE